MIWASLILGLVSVCLFLAADRLEMDVGLAAFIASFLTAGAALATLALALWGFW